MPTQASDGAFIHVRRSRVQALISLHPVDVFNVAIQPDLLDAMTDSELYGIADAVAAALARREKAER
jgi:hypothetical protein